MITDQIFSLLFSFSSLFGCLSLGCLANEACCSCRGHFRRLLSDCFPGRESHSWWICLNRSGVIAVHCSASGCCCNGFQNEAMPAGSRPTTESTSVRAAVDATSISGQFQVVGHRTQLILHVWECMCSLAIISLCIYFLPSLEWVPLQARNRFLFPPLPKPKIWTNKRIHFCT